MVGFVLNAHTLIQNLNIKRTIRPQEPETKKNADRKRNSFYSRWYSSEADVFWFICLNILGKWLVTSVNPIEMRPIPRKR